MPTYAWKGKTRTGEMREGTMQASSRAEAIAALRRQGVTQATVAERGKELALPKLRGSVGSKDIAVFTRQFSVMIDAGLPLVQCLEILAGQQSNKVFAAVLTDVRQDVESGSTLADAMRKHPKVFDDLYANMVAAGEAGGILDTILQRLSTYIEKAVKLKAAVRGALVYPVSVIVIACVVVWVILTFVIPVFADLFAGLGAQLPLPTQIVVNLSNFLRSWWWLVLGVIVAAVVLVRQYYQTPQGRRTLDAFMLKFPVIGTLLRKIAVARFCRTLGTLTSSGVPILDGLDITARTAGNAVVQEAIQNVRKEVEQGKTISEPLAKSGVFPSMVVQMVQVGEQTGAMDTMLSKIADFYEDEVDEATQNLLSLLEPLIILFLGVVIGGIVIAMYMPMFSLISKIG
ncbi:MAG TPA: type II secretion system F family protein [Acidobacteriota bacterium]|nr:type II secretion system F family protein [bacterium]HNX20137.1 type II secretion system F family protein [Acidobacteriota bacterium]